MLSDFKIFVWLKKKYGVERLDHGTFDEWENWRVTNKKNHPIVWFLTETLPDFIENIYYRARDPFMEFRTRFYYRFGYKTHYIPTKLKPGEYHSFDDRLLHGAFTMLEDFVELELAYDLVRWSNSSYKDNKVKYQMPWWHRYWFTRWTAWRSPKAGVDELTWSMGLDFPEHNTWCGDQPARAREIFELYLWWKQTRPNRPDPYEASGWNYIHTQLDEKYGSEWQFSSAIKITPEEDKMYNDASTEVDRITREYSDEDNEMLMRLTKHRSDIFS